MSVFSDRLNKIIQEGNFTLPYLEKESGFSLALISKIKTGKRLPDSEEKMLRLIRALRCPIDVEDTLLKEYRIELMGRDKYMCMEECQRSLESLSQLSTVLPINKNITYEIDTLSSIQGSFNVNMLTQYIIDTEANRDEGHLKIIIQSNFTFVKNYLLSGISAQQKEKLHIEHIIALESTTGTIYNSQNMKEATYCFHLASHYNTNYQVFYHRKNDFSSELFPFCLISSQYALLLSSDCQSGLLLQGENNLTVINSGFDTLRCKCHPFLTSTHDVFEYLQVYDKIIYSRPASEISILELSYVPCILPMIPAEVGFRRMNPNLANIPYIVEFLKTYFKTNMKSICSIFFLKGLDLFMSTGLSFELPREAHEPFSMEERKIILKRLLAKCDKGELTPIVLKENRITIPTEMTLCHYDNDDSIFIWNLPNVPFSSCIIEVSEIRNNFSEFMLYLKNNREYTYTEEESLKLLKEHAQKYLDN